jgi:hypothetical protein
VARGGGGRAAACLSCNARGVQEDDLEDPLPTGSIDETVLGFAQLHQWTPRLGEMLCEPLFARITREIQRRNHSVVPLERVRSANETSRHAVGKQTNVSVNLSMRLGAAGVPIGSRDIEDNYIAVHLVRLLFEGGYAVAGHNVKIEGKPFCTFQECHDYVLDFAERATPFGVPHPPLHRVLKAHCETHALWAKSMRLGKTLSDAMKINESKVSALWLFTCENENSAAQRERRMHTTSLDFITQLCFWLRAVWMSALSESHPHRTMDGGMNDETSAFGSSRPARRPP